MSKWEEWVGQVTDHASARDIADRIGAANTTVSRWIREGVPAEGVIQIARAFDADVVEALCVTDYINEEDIRRSAVLRRVKGATNLQLVEELLRREVARKLLEDPDIDDEGL